MTHMKNVSLCKISIRPTGRGFIYGKNAIVAIFWDTIL